MKKLMALALAFLMVFAVMGQSISLAAEPAAPTKTKSVTLHKLVMPNAELKAHETPADYDGTQDLTAFNALVSKNYTEAEGVYFAWVKAGEGFDVTTSTVDKTKTFEFVKKKNKPAESMTLAAFIALKDRDEYLAGLTTEDGLPFDTSEVPDGDYAILEIRDLSTYNNDDNVLADSKAVPVRITLPFVNNDGVVTHAHVYPKNTEEKPKVDKDFATDNEKTEKHKLNGTPDAGNDRREEQRDSKVVGNAFIGQKVKFTVDTIVPAKSNYGAFRWSDVMTKGLTFNRNAKNIKDSNTFTGDVKFAHEDYDLIADDYGFTLTLTEKGLEKINGKEKQLKFQINYSATVNGSAWKRVDKNNIMLEYDHKPFQDNEPKPTTPDDENTNISVTKTWAEGDTLSKETTVVYSLYKKADHSLVKSVSITGTKAADFNYTFTGLEAGVQYYVRERVVGYNARYDDIVTQGTIPITNNKPNHPHEDPDEPSIESGGKKFVKADATNPKERLAGAEFVVKNNTGDDNNGKFLKVVEKTGSQAFKDAQDAYEAAIETYNTEAAKGEKAVDLAGKKAAIQTAREARDKAFLEQSQGYTWVDEEDATKFVSGDDGRFEVVGLAFGNYILKEIKAPAGYALPTNSEFSFEVGKNSYDQGDINYDPGHEETQDAQRIENKKTNIPQTGGIGTIVFTVAGLAVMGTALMSLRKRRQEA